MSLPTIRLYVGLDRTVRIEGPGASFSFSDYSEAKLVCAKLGIDKSTTDSAEAVIQNAGADLDVHFLAADVGTTQLATIYQVIVKSGSKWFPVSSPGVLEVWPAGGVG